jgi:hypothetical protein
MLGMTNATASAPTRLVLVGERTPGGPGRSMPAIRRRYRLARLQHVGDGTASAAVHEHLRRSYD